MGSQTDRGGDDEEQVKNPTAHGMGLTLTNSRQVNGRTYKEKGKAKMTHVSSSHIRASAMAKLIILIQSEYEKDSNEQRKSSNSKDKKSSDKKTRKQRGLSVCSNDISSHSR